VFSIHDRRGDSRLVQDSTQAVVAQVHVRLGRGRVAIEGNRRSHCDAIRMWDTIDELLQLQAV
jgi:hypothetical protein